MTERERQILQGGNVTAINADEHAITAAMKEMAEGVELPKVSATDNGKVLGVVNGKWNKGDFGGGAYFVPFTIIDETPTTTADFADVTAAVAAGKNVIAQIDLGNNTILYAPLQIKIANALLFSTVIDFGSEETPEPQRITLSYAADGCTLNSVDLAVAT